MDENGEVVPIRFLSWKLYLLDFFKNQFLSVLLLSSVSEVLFGSAMMQNHAIL